MQSVGTRLREAREKKGFSLEHVSAQTRINSKNLSAIECDEVKQISSPFFYRSFVRQYAETVDFDFRLLASSVEVLAGHMRQPDLPGQGEHQIVRVAPLQARRKKDWSWLTPSAILLSIVGLGSGGYAYLKHYNPSLLRNTSVSAVFAKPSEAKWDTNAASHSVSAAALHTAQPANDGHAPADTTIAVVAEDAASRSVPKIPPPSPSTTTPSNSLASSLAHPLVNPGTETASSRLLPVTPASDKIRIELAATERTWLSVSADGKQAYIGILEPAQTKILEGQDSARLRTGNAGGVNIVFNGKPIGAIGPRGTTRTVIFSKTGYQIEPEGASLARSNRIGG